MLHFEVNVLTRYNYSSIQGRSCESMGKSWRMQQVRLDAENDEKQQKCCVIKSKAKEKFYITVVRPVIMYGFNKN